jgi:cobaltochelatase CobS subunit
MKFNPIAPGSVTLPAEAMMVAAHRLVYQLHGVLANKRGFTKMERNHMKQAITTLFHDVYGAFAMDDLFREAVNTSPLCGTGDKQLNPRPTWAGVRDYMSMEDLFMPVIEALCENMIVDFATSDEWHKEFAASLASKISAIAMALREPAGEGWVDPDNKTGYAFGRSWEIGTLFDNPRDDLEERCILLSVTLRANAPKELIDLVNDCLITPPTKKETDMTKTATAVSAAPTTLAASIKVPTGSPLQLINMVLSQNGMPEIEKIISELNDATARIAAAEATAKRANEEAAKIKLGAGTVVAAPTGSTDIPNGKIALAKAKDLFPVKSAAFDFELPIWNWDAAHPHVPEIDTDYVFREDSLLKVLYALLTNQPCYLHGHTGSGKTTLVEQVAARLNWPFARVNFDSEITRLDLIGRDVLGVDPTTGSTLSRFEEGILPRTMAQPYIMCFDEIDFVRPDIAYVMQRALEGNGLMLTEDGGRMIKPHMMFRIFATGNTVGQGDEFGMYQGARPQSMAFLDRFTVWIKVDYLSPADRFNLIKKHVPDLPDADAKVIDQYVGEHLEAFVNANVMQPISPRGYLALAEATAKFYTMYPATEKKKAMKLAFNMTILDRATAQDRAVLTGIIDRVTR